MRRQAAGSACCARCLPVRTKHKQQLTNVIFQVLVLQGPDKGKAETSWGREVLGDQRSVQFQRISRGHTAEGSWGKSVFTGG